MKQACIVSLSVVIVGLLIVGVAWWFWPQTTDAQVAKVQQLQQQMFQDRTSLTEPQRREMFTRLRGEMDKLTEPQREQVRREMFTGFRERMAAEVKKFHALPPDQRSTYLDERIDEMETRRRQGGMRPGGPGRVGGTQRVGGPARGDGATASRPEGRFGGGPGGSRNLSEEQREQRRRERLDNSTARDRAEFVAFFEAIQQRRKERGLPDLGPPRR